MTTTQTAEEGASVRVQNVGGISETRVALDPGVNVLSGRNATNRTSFLQGIMAGIGSENVSLKGDAEEGRVELTIGDRTFTRRLSRTGEGVSMGGDPYLDDPELADLFAFLLENNEARRAVAAGRDLREVIMRPVDTDAIRAEIDRLEAEKREIEAELERADELEADREDLLTERERLRGRIEEVEAAIEDKQSEIEAADADLREGREGKAELESKLEALRDARSELGDVRFRLDTERESLSELRREREELEERLDELPETPTDRLDQLETRLSELRDRKRSVEGRISQLQGLIQFNESVLDGDEIETLDLLHRHDGETDGVTDRLVDDGSSLVCWTCGASTSRDDVEETLDRLRDRHRDLVNERSEVTDELEAARSRRSEIQEKRRDRTDVRDRRDRIEDEIEETEAAIERLSGREEDLEAKVEELDEDVEELREEDVTAVIDLHAEANELELELGQLRSELEAVEEELDSVEDRLDDRDELRERRSAVADSLADARTRIDRLEDEAVEEFNGRMDEVLSILRYDNLERIWIERIADGGRSGRGAGEGNRFALHVVRDTDGGSVYEDSVDHLSESEREVTGLVFALAGYLVHEVHETVPFVLLDSLEAIDANRIARLIDYFGEYVPYLVVALLSEDAEALDDAYNRVTSI